MDLKLVNEFTLEDMTAKWHFLESRAISHLRSEALPIEHREPLAASLLTDCAALALMCGFPEKANGYFKQSGHLYLQHGLTAGLLNLALVSSDDMNSWLNEDGSSYFDQFDVSFDQQESQINSYEPDLRRHRTFATSLNSPENGAKLLLAEAIAFGSGGHEVLNSSSRIAKNRLAAGSDFEIGVTGMHVGAFLKTIDLLSPPFSELSDSGRMPDPVRKFLQRALFERDYLIEALRRDEWHWKRIPHPAKLLDLDLLGIALLYLRSGAPAKRLFSDWQSESKFLLLPFRAAKRLFEAR